MLNRLLNLLYPRRCPICDDIVIPKGNLVCDSCKDILTPLREPLCYKCGRQILSSDREYCDTCLNYNFSFDKAFSLWPYNHTVKSSLSNFKYKGRREYANYYGSKLCEHYSSLIKSLNIDVIIPVPVHRERLKDRGYNQAMLIASDLSKRLSIPLAGDYLIRSKNTVAQKNLDPIERRKNLREAFSINKPSTYYSSYIRSVLLIDDIYTTGSTANACAAVLKESGAKNVYVLCMASVRAT